MMHPEPVIVHVDLPPDHPVLRAALAVVLEMEVGNGNGLEGRHQ